jgi:Co/Zn/Cd efflux system component
LTLGKRFGWLWMDPVAGIVGALVIANWSFALVRATGGILLDMHPDTGMADRIREIVEVNGDQLLDLHLWRLGPGHLGAIVSVLSERPRDVRYYHAQLAQFESLSHITVEVRHGS